MANKLFKDGNCVVIINDSGEWDIPATDFWFKPDKTNETYSLKGSRTMQTVTIKRSEISGYENNDIIPVAYDEETFKTFLRENSLLTL